MRKVVKADPWGFLLSWCKAGSKLPKITDFPTHLGNPRGLSKSVMSLVLINVLIYQECNRDKKVHWQTYQT